MIWIDETTRVYFQLFAMPTKLYEFYQLITIICTHFKMDETKFSSVLATNQLTDMKIEFAKFSDFNLGTDWKI